MTLEKGSANKDSLKRLIYIMSPSYSGSTLLTFLLASHPDIATVGELKATAIGDAQQYLCSCGSHLTECGFWNQVAVEMEQKGRSFSLSNFGTHFSSPSYLCDKILRSGVRGRYFEILRDYGFLTFPQCRKERESILDQNLSLMDVISHLQGAELFLDGSKDPVRIRHFVDSGCWDVRVIFLIRDGRGVANSYMQHNHVSMEIAAQAWVDKSRELEEQEKRLVEGTCLRVCYEDLCRRPDHVLHDIFEFIGIDPDQAHREYHSFDYHVLGNAMRLKSSNEIRLDEKWKTKLSAHDLDVFESIGGKLNRQFGYKAF